MKNLKEWPGFGKFDQVKDEGPNTLVYFRSAFPNTIFSITVDSEGIFRINSSSAIHSSNVRGELEAYSRALAFIKEFDLHSRIR